MATLTNQQINLTYPGLIKLDDNGAVQPTALKTLTDGTGGTLALSVSQIETKFTAGSLVDFTGVTVSGLAAGGLVAGGGPDSMQSAAFLSPNAANASGTGAIALGNASNASGDNSVSIGNFGTAASGDGIRIGGNNNCISDGLISIGQRGTVSGNISIGLGFEANVSGGASIFMATGGQSFGTVSGGGSIALVPGDFASNLSAAGAVVIGSSSTNKVRVTSENGVAIGKSSESTANNAVAIGVDTLASQDNAVALGAGVQAARTATVSMTGLEIQNASLGMILFSPGGTAYRVTVTDAGALVVATA